MIEVFLTKDFDAIKPQRSIEFEGIKYTFNTELPEMERELQDWARNTCPPLRGVHITTEGLLSEWIATETTRNTRRLQKNLMILPPMLIRDTRELISGIHAHANGYRNICFGDFGYYLNYSSGILNTYKSKLSALRRWRKVYDPLDCFTTAGVVAKRAGAWLLEALENSPNSPVEQLDGRVIPLKLLLTSKVDYKSRREDSRYKYDNCCLGCAHSLPTCACCPCCGYRIHSITTKCRRCLSCCPYCSKCHHHVKEFCAFCNEEVCSMDNHIYHLCLENTGAEVI